MTDGLLALAAVMVVFLVVAGALLLGLVPLLQQVLQAVPR